MTSASFRNESGDGDFLASCVKHTQGIRQIKMEARFQGIYRDGNTFSRTRITGALDFNLPVISPTAIPLVRQMQSTKCSKGYRP
ncbi:MAG: hypothetical protein WCA10_03605 [Terracidiphilus sp.]